MHKRRGRPERSPSSGPNRPDDTPAGARVRARCHGSRDPPVTLEGTEGTLEIRGDPLLPGSIAGIGFEGHDEGAFVTQPIWTNLEQGLE